MEALLELRGISKAFGTLKAVDNLSLTVGRGEVFSLLGPSGCGKTTLLRLLAGFLQPDDGEIILAGENLTRIPPEKRPVNTVFQNYALFPHLSLRANIGFGLKVAKRSKAEIRQEVDRMLHLIQMEDHADKFPHQISGGQKQRVAIARALVNKPKLLLLDEPLAALDLKLRQRMLLELDRIHDEVGITFIYVTHDQGEAMSLSDRIAVMNAGVIEQLGSPAEIYETPRTRFVAGFIGDANVFSGRISSVPENPYLTLEVLFGDQAYQFSSWFDGTRQAGETVSLSIRPEKISITYDRPEAAARQNLLRGVVEDRIYLGSQTQYRVRVASELVLVLEQHGHCLLDSRQITWGDEVWLRWHADDGQLVREGGA
jgi:spermidine/putrescine transport system ATP-binding protein